MTITSKGYEGTVDAGADWADVQMTLASRFWVRGGAAQVAPLSAGTRQVTVSTGTLGGAGIYDKITETETVTLPTVASGTEWFLIKAIRTWAAEGASATTIGYQSAGTSNPATTGYTLPTITNTPGTVDEQPLALVPLTSGQTVPGTPIDLRIVREYAGGEYSAASELVLQYCGWIGTYVRIGTTLWRNGYLSTGGARQWFYDPGPYGSVVLSSSAVSVANRAGFNADTCTGIRDGNVVQLDLQLKHVNTDITFSTTGALVDFAVCTITPTAFRPDRMHPCRAQIITSDNAAYGADVRIDTDGTVSIISGPPTKTLRIDAARVSLSINTTFVKGS